MDAAPATLGGFLLVEQAVFRGWLAVGRERLAGERVKSSCSALQPLAAGGLLAGLVGRVPEPVHHEAVHFGLAQGVGDRFGEVVEVGVGQREVEGGGGAVAEVGVLLAPAGVGGNAEVAHDLHAAGVAQADEPSGEVMAEPGLRRDLAAPVPGIAVAGNGEGLDDVGAEPGIPSEVLLRVGIGPKPGRRKAVGPARPPVEVNAEGADGLGGVQGEVDGQG